MSDLSTLQRLLRYPHAAVFDKSPEKALAFTLRHPLGSSWSIKDAVLSVVAGGVTRTYELAPLTVGGLAGELQADGFLVENLTTDWRLLSALALVEEDGSELQSNGDRVSVFTSLLWVLMSAYASELRAAKQQIPQALRQMVIGTSEGEWLDLWGSLYADARRPAESDTAYAQRIPQEAFRIRCNARAIEVAIKDATGFDVRIEEPWEDVFTLDESVLSGPHKTYDGETIGYHLIKPTAREPVDWPQVLSVIDRNRAAGVMVLGLETTLSFHVDATDTGVVHLGATQFKPSAILYEDGLRLDYMEFGETPVENEAARHRREIRRQSVATVDPSSYVVGSRAGRDYRVLRLGVEYTPLTWPAASWSSFGVGATWSDATVVASRHTRGS